MPPRDKAPEGRSTREARGRAGLSRSCGPVVNDTAINVVFCCVFFSGSQQDQLHLLGKASLWVSTDHGVPARSRAGCRAFSKSGPLCIPVTDRRPLRTSQKPVRTKPLARRTLPRVKT